MKEKETDELASQHSERLKEIEAVHNAAIVTVKEQLSVAEKERDEERNRIQALEEQRGVTALELQALLAKQEELQKEGDVLREHLKEVKMRLDQKEQEHAQQVTRLKKENDAVVASVQEQVWRVEKERDEVGHRVQELEVQRDDTGLRLASLESSKVQLEKELKELRTEVEVKSKRIENAEKENEEAERSMASSAAHSATLEGKLKDVEASHEKLRKELEAKEQTWKEREEKVQADAKVWKEQAAECEGRERAWLKERKEWEEMQKRAEEERSEWASKMKEWVEKEQLLELRRTEIEKEMEDVKMTYLTKEAAWEEKQRSWTVEASSWREKDTEWEKEKQTWGEKHAAWEKEKVSFEQGVQKLQEQLNGVSADLREESRERKRVSEENTSLQDRLVDLESTLKLKEQEHRDVVGLKERALQETQAQYTQDLLNLQSHGDEAQSVVESLKSRMEATEAEKKQLLEEGIEREKNHSTAIQELVTAHQTEVNEKNEEISDLEKVIAKLEESKMQTESKLQEVTRKREESEREAKENAKQCNLFEVEIVETRAECALLRNSLETLRKDHNVALESHLNEIASLQDKLKQSGSLVQQLEERTRHGKVAATTQVEELRSELNSTLSSLRAEHDHQVKGKSHRHQRCRQHHRRHRLLFQNLQKREI